MNDDNLGYNVGNYVHVVNYGDVKIVGFDKIDNIILPIVADDEKEFKVNMKMIKPIELTHDWFIKINLKFHKALIIESYYIDILVNDYYFKQLSFSYNNDKSYTQYYCYFRDGDTEKERHHDDIVCLRNDVQFVHEVQNLYNSISKTNKI